MEDCHHPRGTRSALHDENPPGGLKETPYTDINPNGRVPAIEDPNTGFVVWESGACKYYLTETYDKEHKLSYASGPEKYQVMSWLMFQMSGQGPYFGQFVWFGKYHSEKIPSAIERYGKEIERVTMVIDSHLAARPEGSQHCLVGDKVTYADLAFVPWALGVPRMLGDKAQEVLANFPKYQAWLNGLT